MGTVPRRVDPARVLFFALAGAVVLAGAFWVGVEAGVERNAVFRAAMRVRLGVEHSLRVTGGELFSFLANDPVHFTQASRYAGSGVTFNDPSNDPGDLILLSGFFEGSNELRLIRRDGTIVARWPVRYFDYFSNTDHFPPGWAPASNWNIDTHGALALPDGSVVFNFEWGGLVKLDRCGDVAWTIRRQTHHSVERAEGGGFWVAGRRVVDGETPYPPFETPFHEDTILRVSDDGRIVSETSAVKLFYENGLEAVLTASGHTFTAGMEWDREIVHLNKIEELPAALAPDFPMFEAGDLALSIREINLVMVVDRTATRVKWWKIGPWVRQHDPEFRPGGRIVVFNNNMYSNVFPAGTQKTPPSTPQVSNIIEIDPATNDWAAIYGGRPGEQFLSVVRGKVEVTPRGGLLITEADGGRIRETDANRKLLWEYVNRFGPDEVAEINEARLYAPGYFTVNTWSCTAPL